MVDQFETEEISENEFRLLSVAGLINKLDDQISLEELYSDAERKFYTLIEILNDKHDDFTIKKFGYSMNDLKEKSFLILNRLISDEDTNSYITLCVAEDASIDEIRKRRNMLLNIFHPDKNPGNVDNVTLTRLINEAYDYIINNKNRSDDMFGTGSHHIPPSYPYNNREKRNMKIIMALIIILSLLVFLGFINNAYYH